jgi:carboxymethylenebutenolidase
MSDRVSPFTLHQIGTGSVRFPSGIPLPTISDSSVDPYFKTRIPKEVQVEGIEFWPQEKGIYPGVVVLHEAWGLNEQIKEFANRLACEGSNVIVPNLYGRQGGMITANADVAEALAARIKESDLLQDINSCCEFLNTREQIKRNVHGVIGFGMGGSLAIRFACQRKRLRAAVSFYAKVTTPSSVLKELSCPLLYHRAGADPSVTSEEIDRLNQDAKDSGKHVDVQTYKGAPYAFCHEARKESYHPESARQAWESTVAFLHTHLT